MQLKLEKNATLGGSEMFMCLVFGLAGIICRQFSLVVTPIYTRCGWDEQLPNCQKQQQFAATVHCEGLIHSTSLNTTE